MSYKSAKKYLHNLLNDNNDNIVNRDGDLDI